MPALCAVDQGLDGSFVLALLRYGVVFSMDAQLRRLHSFIPSQHIADTHVSA